jgi:DnaJ family protein C protein 11
MSKMKMEQALEDVANMACTVPLKREEEERKKGLVIVNATYGLVGDAAVVTTTTTTPNGNTSATSTLLNSSDDDDGTSIDVTIPMQCMVEGSALVIPGGESKVWLSGFYDPCIGEPKQLRVRYLFWGRLHEVVINDEDQLKIPVKGHLLGDEVQFRAEVRE